MDDPNQLNPGHTGIRTFLRVVGPLVLGTGVIFVIIAVASFFRAFGTFEPPRYFWCAFVGMPLIAIGGIMVKAGFIGAIVRYGAAEIAPVGKDTGNYLAHGLKPGIRSVAQSVMEGIDSARKPRFCTQCGTSNDTDAKFCKSCGNQINTT